MAKRTAGLVLCLALAVAGGCHEPDRSAGEIQGAPRTPAQVAANDDAVSRARTALAARANAPRPHPRHVLFGDLHVHSTFSIDAFTYALPLFAGEGAHPPADACDFARYCSQVDFFSINDHAEGLTGPRWRETIESIRECNARAGDPAHPDLVAYVGYEWTQVGATPADHYGHRNVVFPGLEDEALPPRPVTSLPEGITDRARAMWLVNTLQRLRFGLGDYADFLWLLEQIARMPDCPPDPDDALDCRENATTPAELLAHLEGYETLLIPHGLAWGVHAPQGARLDVSLANGNHDPDVERLIEIFSGHGNSEEYRAFPELDASQEPFPECPAPTPDFLPCCWRAGELVRERCGDLPADECETRVEEARRLAIRAGVSPHLVLPDTRPEDWLDCDQCRDCFKPAMALRPRQSAQYSLAVTNPDASEDEPERFRWGFIASTDNHAARPATGYKQYERLLMTDARGIATERLDGWTRWWIIGRQADPRRAQAAPSEARGFRGLFDVERGASFMYPGGLVAVHAAGRDRRSIWDALMRREVYGTSGPRILLWFDLLNGPDGAAPMGSAVALGEAPRFEVRAAGSFVQKPGCPEDSHRGLAADRLERLCRGECYHPSDERVPIAAIEIVRVRPQVRAGEPVAPLIEDPWLRLECEPDPAGCVKSFADPEFADSGRDAVYYARALQVETPAINAANQRTEFDADGNAVRTSPCHGSYRTPADDDCLAPAAERAWSSPIFVDQPLAGRSTP